MRKWPREGERREETSAITCALCKVHDNAPLLGAWDDLHLPHFLHQLCLLFYRRQRFQHLLIVFSYNNTLLQRIRERGRGRGRVNRKLLLLSNDVKWIVCTLLHIHSVKVKVTLTLAPWTFLILSFSLSLLHEWSECICFTGTNLLPLKSIFIVIKKRSRQQFTRHHSPSHFYSSVADETSLLSRKLIVKWIKWNHIFSPYSSV